MGTVDAVRMGDQEAVTDAGQSTRDVGLLSDGEGAGISQQAQHRLERVGYVRIDRSSLFSGSDRPTPRLTRSRGSTVTTST